MVADFDSWSAFGRWLARLRPWLDTVQRRQCDGDGGGDSGIHFRDWEIWKHLRPMADMLAGRHECSSPGSKGAATSPSLWRLEEYEIVHLETADADIAALGRRLCDRGVLEQDVRGNCEALPSLGRRNEGLVRFPPPSWRELWDAATIAHAVALYSEDFDVFGYNRDPLTTAPMVAKS
eukprot:gnl/TRDRNA2_/TRDRNA2_163696_c0_seq7.p2 gnl/TRDRNA2_/TRDRNA2_163696_c0~~gnl/TRDRNA2_/TRDRNA2_163696_c0_seq7.p2  ORF type:complete len:178 (+),score=33.68 gnl/TRDRNA2_/TRDRNA2_163696_c0_seq7:161-694(+)